MSRSRNMRERKGEVLSSVSQVAFVSIFGSFHSSLRML